MNKILTFGLSVALFITLTFALSSCEPQEKFTYVEITTPQGTMEAKLYNSTPLHRDNFIKLAKEGYYNDLLFHRVINGFMAQGGDPDSKGAPAEKVLGMGGPGYQTPAEIGEVHIKGALAAARDGNPQKMSSGSQFYIVHGRNVTDASLDQMQQMKGIVYTPEQRKLYTSLGGTPDLDNEYTVFGELTKGYDVIDKICTQPVGASNRPVQDIPMQVRVISK